MARPAAAVNWADRDRMDFFRCFNEAEGLYLLGYSLREIEARLQVLPDRLTAWAEKYQWQAKREAMMVSPKGIGAMLHEVLQKQMQELIVKDALTVEEVEKITKLTTLIKKVEAQGGNFFAAAIEVMRAFSVWFRKNCDHRDEYHQVSTWIQNYLRTLTDV